MRLRHALALGFAVVGLAARPDALSAQVTPKHGDVNGDGVVSALDAQAILSAVVGIGLPGSFLIANGVAKCDGRVTPTALDAQIVLSFVIGLNTSQYCVGQTFGPGATTVSISPADSSLLINRGMVMKATLQDNLGFLIKRPIAWSTSNPSIVTIDSVRGDSLAFVRATANAGSSTITATSDGSSFMTQLKVFLSYAGIIITPQRGDTIRQIGSTKSFSTKSRDSVGVVTGNPPVFWSIADTAIADVSTSTQFNATVIGKQIGTTLLRAVSTSNSLVRDSVPVTIALPPVNTCTPGTGSLHQAATYTAPQTWTAAANPHFVTGTLNFNSGSRLTIGPGVLVCLNSSGNLLFHAGSRLMARGTVAQPITFTLAPTTTSWGIIQLGDNLGFTGTTTDTSVITNAVLDHGGFQVLTGYDQHTLVIDSVQLRQSAGAAVRVAGPGSRLSRSTIDTVAISSSGQPAVFIGRGTVEETTIRNGVGGAGIQLFDLGTVRNVGIVGGQQGISNICCANGSKINDVTISGTTGMALDLQNYNLALSSANVQISGGTGGSFRGTIGNLGILFPDSLKQSTLKGNGRGDSLFVTGGVLTGTNVVVRPDLPWLVSSFITVDTLAQLIVRPGARITFASAGIAFQSGGTLDARGEANKFITFASSGGGNYLSGLLFQNPGAGGVPALAPTAVSQLSFVRVDSAIGVGNPTGSQACCSAAIAAGDRHRLLIDSAIVRKAQQGAIYISTPGSEIRRSLIDTTGVPANNYAASYVAVGLGNGTLMQNSTVRRAGNVGVSVAGTGVQLQNVRITASTSAGLQAEFGSIATSSSVRVDSANAYPFRGKIENLAVIAPDSISQANSFLMGPSATPANIDQVVEITGGTLTGTGTLRTLTAIPQIRWLVTNSQPVIDTLAELAPRPGARFTFSNSGFLFQRGGRLNAVGLVGRRILFQPVSGSVSFYGLQFSDPGPGPTPALAPTATSTLSYVQLDSAQGQGYPGSGLCCASAAIYAGDHHRLLIDSLIVRKAQNAAVWMSTPGSQIISSRIDTTGNIATLYTSSYAAVALGAGTILQDTRVLRSGNVGVHAPGAGVRLKNVRIAASQGVALNADAGVLVGDLGTVKADSANAYPFRGKIENLAILAPDSVTQANSFLLGASATPANVDQVIEITGGTLAGTTTLRTLTAIPQIRWQVTNAQPVIDTLAELAPRPGARFRFSNSGFLFQSGGRLNAVGLAGRRILFEPAGAGVNFYGLQFTNPGAGGLPPASAPTATSTLSFVQLDSAQGQGYPGSGLCCASAAIYAGDHHKLLMDSLIVRKAHQAAVWMSTPGSTLTASRIDTTGLFSNGYTTSQAAVALGAGTTLQDTRVLRSGNVGVYAPGAGVRLTNVRIAGSQSVALNADAGILVGDLGTVKADSANAYPFRGRIENLAVLAPDSISQANAFLLGASATPANVDQVIEITGGTLAGTTTLRTLTAIPQIRWQITNSQPVIDTLAQLAPRPGARLTFFNGGFLFQSGGTLNAVGATGRRILFQPVSGANGNFYGLQFTNPGSGGLPAGSAPIAQSTLSYVQLDSAQGQGYPGSGICCASAAIYAGDHHRLLMDSLIVRKAHQAAVWMSTPGSQIASSRIDTTGLFTNLYTSSYAAVALGAGAVLQDTRVLRSGNVGVYAPGAGVRLTNVRIAASQGVALNADAGILVGDLGTVKADSGNAYPFRGKIENLAVLAPDSISQANAFLLGASATPANLDQVIEITGGTLAGTTSLRTLTAIPQLRWQITNSQPVIDTLAELAPRPGARFTFFNGGFLFQSGGTLNAVGATGRRILFQPVSGANGNFYGLQFSNPGTGGFPPASAPIATSTLSFVQLDSAQGQGSPGGGICCASAAIYSGDHHKLLMDNLIVRKAHNAAVWMAAPGSILTASRIDTTGLFNNGFTTSQSAVAVGTGTSVTSTTIRRSGNTGLVIVGTGIDLTGTRVVQSQNLGVQFSTGSTGGTFSSFAVDSSAGVGIAISANGVAVTNCDAHRGSSHGIATTNQYTGAAIHDCNIVGNAVRGVNNFEPTNVAFVIDATTNWWGLLDGTGAPTVPAVGVANGPSTNVTTSARGIRLPSGNPNP